MLFRSLLVALALSFGVSAVASAQSLWWWQQRVDWSFKVDQLTPDVMSNWIETQGDDVVLFDVREPDEHAVSHIANAIHVSPDMTADEFKRRFGGFLQGRKAVFYCSIGWRSSDFADRMAPVLAELGVESSHNLRGGIFRWHNEQRPLTDSGGSTDFVHPYDADWGSLVQRQDMTSYQEM